MQPEALVIIGAVVFLIVALAIRANRKTKGGSAPKPGDGIPKKPK